MTHFAVMVITDRTEKFPVAEAEDIVEGLIGQFREDGEWGADGTRFDWFQIGGRYTGTLDGYDPEQDPANKQTCRLCQGTGKRKDMLVEHGCNGCAGSGVETVWPTQREAHEGDVQYVRDVPKDDPFYAIVTPEGQWLERSRAGLFATVRPQESGELMDKAPDVWATEYTALLEKYPDHVAVVVDCHV